MLNGRQDSHGDLPMIGPNIHRLRKQRGLTLSELAERTGVSKSYLSNIERSIKQNPSIQVMERIAAVLKVDLKLLLRLAVEPDPKQPPDKDWFEFVEELKKSGLEGERLQEYKMLIEFMTWYKQRK